MPYSPPAAGGGGSVVFFEEGSAVGTATNLNFVGAGVTATYSGGTAIATIPGGTALGSIVFLDEGVTAGTATHLNVVGSGGTVAYSGGTATLTITGGSGTEDPIADILGTADTAYEFGSSSLAGLTALSPTPDVESAHTIIPGHLYYMDNASSTSWCGRYFAPPSAPFTAVTKISGGNMRADYNRACLFIGEATPGNIDVLEWGASGRTVALERFSNPTTYSSTVTAGVIFERPPVYLAIRVNSSSDVDFLRSWDGRVWQEVTVTRNPSITIGSVGIAMKSENSSGAAVAFDFLRVWNSAKSFPGVVD